MKKTIIITGGNAGLGLECARNLLSSGPEYQVLMASRNPEKAAEVARQLEAQTGRPGAVSVLELDLAALDSVRNFAKNMVSMLESGAVPPLFGLVCNAGIQLVTGGTESQRTAEGFEETFGVNHLGHFLLTHLLLPHLSQPGRVVVVSSGTHYSPRVWQSSFFGIPAPEYLGAEALARGEIPVGLSMTKANQFRYATSKFCNLIFAYELSKRLKNKGLAVTVNAYDPGLMPGTGLARANPAAVVWIWKNLMPVLRIFNGVYSVKISGRNLARLITDPALTGVTGRYFESPTEKRSSADSYNETYWAELWAGSERLLADKGFYTRSPAIFSPR